MLRRLSRFIVILILGGTTFLAHSVRAQDTMIMLDGNPAWSPDGRRIAFEAISLTDYNRAYGQPLDEYNWDIWVMNPDGTGRVNLTPDSPFYDADPGWSPDENAIAFASNRSGNMDVWLMRVDGTNPVNLTSADLNYDRGYSWSPDGRWIAYIAENIRGVSYDIWLVEPNGASATKLTSWENHLYGSLSWSPDSSAIAFTSEAIDPDVRAVSEIRSVEQSQPEGIWIMSLDGSEPIGVTGERRDWDVAWSPLGDTLATTLFTGLGNEIWLVTVDGSQLTNLADITPDLEHSPTWSPDGSRIAFVAGRPGMLLSQDIWVMQADGADPRNLTEDIGFLNERPSWSPDGLQIAFVSHPVDTHEPRGFGLDADIWVMNADGSDPVNLTGE